MKLIKICHIIFQFDKTSKTVVQHKSSRDIVLKGGGGKKEFATVVSGEMSHII
jgi:hypothetical protein